MNSEAKKYLCIHGHFYQPPRENPWMDAVELEASAYPFHDWNERITRECYGPNAWARLHDGEGHILKLINNYETMSFNFGPTLLTWMENSKPEVYQKIIAADQESRARFEGHGNAMAQVYNHIIMPLASRRDKLTQIKWGLADFMYRFGRDAEGMWLAETAVDRDTLEIMADLGVKFTVLSPYQAQAVRSLDGGEDSWRDVSAGKVDTTKPYRVFLGSSRSKSIDVFFYDGSLSKAVAYEKILNSGQEFLSRIARAFGENVDQPKLVSIATDGESYGHHFKFGDLALAWLFDHLKANGDIRLTNYAAFLERFPPQNEAKLIENSSWSCAHGVERWRADCGCNISQTPGWNQAWRVPLREGLNWLSDKLAIIFEEQGSRLFRDPWNARDAYVSILLNPSQEQKDQFLGDHAGHPLGKEELTEAFQLLESQRMAVFMFTSCGWFFDDISRLESAQVLKYAARAIDLVGSRTKEDLEAGLTEILSKAVSNEPKFGHGGDVYEKKVEPSRIDPSRATAHYGLMALVDSTWWAESPLSKMVQPGKQYRFEDENPHAILGETKVVEEKTGREFIRAFLALYMNDLEIACYVGERPSSKNLENAADAIKPLLISRNVQNVVTVFRNHFPVSNQYELEDLIPDSRDFLIRHLVRGIEQQMEESIRKKEDVILSFLSYFLEIDERPPEKLQELFRLMTKILFDDLMVQDKKESVSNSETLNHMFQLAQLCSIALNEPMTKFKVEKYIQNQIALSDKEHHSDTIEIIILLLNLADEVSMGLDLWECQNTYYDLYSHDDFVKSLKPDFRSSILALGKRLGFLCGEDKT